MPGVVNPTVTGGDSYPVSARSPGGDSHPTVPVGKPTLLSISPGREKAA
jgi:hypothetical protein